MNMSWGWTSPKVSWIISEQCSPKAQDRSGGVEAMPLDMLLEPMKAHGLKVKMGVRRIWVYWMGKRHFSSLLDVSVVSLREDTFVQWDLSTDMVNKRPCVVPGGQFLPGAEGARPWILDTWHVLADVLLTSPTLLFFFPPMVLSVCCVFGHTKRLVLGL